MNLFSFLIGRDNDGLEEMEIARKLNKIPPKKLSIETYKRLDRHMRECATMARMTLILLLFLALSKLADIFHLPGVALKAFFDF